MKTNIEIELEKIKAKNFDSEEEKNKELESLYKISNNNENLLFEIGKSYFLLNKFDLAIKFLLKVLQINEFNINSVDLLNKSYKSQNKIYKCLRLLYKYRYYFGDIANEEIISIYLNKQRYDLAIKYIHKYIKEIYPIKDEIYKYAISLISKYNVEIDRKKVCKYSKKILANINKDKDMKFYNSVLNELEIAQQKVILKSYPRRMTVSLTSACNINCKMCPYDKDKLFQLSNYQVDNIIKILPYIEEIEWNGGEVFLFEHFNELLDIAYKNKVKQYITSNGLLINEEYAGKIVKYDINLTLSIDSTDKVLYENIRVGADFDLLVKNIEKINFYSKKFNKKTKLSINCVLSKWNYKYSSNFINIIKFAEKYNFSDVRISIDQYDKDKELINNILLYFQGQKDSLIKLSKDLNINLQFIMPQLNALYKQYDENFNPAQRTCFEKEQTDTCFLPFKKIYVSFNGIMRPECLCQSLAILSKEKNINADSLNIYDSIENFWNGNELIDLRKKIYINKLDCSKKCYLPDKVRYNI